jgi:hypothetical protein
LQVLGATELAQIDQRVRHQFGSDIHVMLVLHCRSYQVVGTNEQFNGPDMIGELLGKVLTHH